MAGFALTGSGFCVCWTQAFSLGFNIAGFQPGVFGVGAGKLFKDLVRNEVAPVSGQGAGLLVPQTNQPPRICVTRSLPDRCS